LVLASPYSNAEVVAWVVGWDSTRSCCGQFMVVLVQAGVMAASNRLSPNNGTGKVMGGMS